MKRKVASGIMLTLSLISMLTLAFKIQPVKTEPMETKANSLSSGSSWPMFHHDVTHSGYSPSSAPNRNATLWNYTTDNWVYSSPAVSEGKVYIGSYDNKVYALNASTGAHVWNYTTGDFVFSSPAVADGKVYVGSMDGKVYALNASTGAHIWNYTTGSFVDSSPAVLEDKVFVGSLDKKVYALNATTGAFIWSYTTGYWVFSSPAVADDKVFVGSLDKKVYALNASTGAFIWSYTTGDGVYSSPAVSNGKVFIGSRDGKVYALNASTGAQVWSYTTGSLVDSSPAVSEGKVFIGSYDKKVYALNASTGTPIWSYTTGGYIGYSSPAVADGKVFIGSRDGKVYALNASTGASIWNYTTGDLVDSSPAVSDDKVFIGSSDNKVYAFGSHDVAIMSVTPSVTEAFIGEIVNITVVVKNKGTETETFNVTAYYNVTAIETKTVANLAPNAETTLTFNLNTTIAGFGTYIIKAVASTVLGETDTADNTYIDGTVKIIGFPFAYFTYSPTIPLTLEAITFNASLSTPDGGTIISYEWDFGDGTPNATGIITAHAYTDNGTYTVTLTVKDDDGLTDTYSQNINVLNRPPTVFFTESATTAYKDVIIYFNASDSYDPDGYIASYFWDFGDGTNATGVTVDHAYAQKGNFTVTLTLTDDDGMSASTSAIKNIFTRPDVAITNVTPQRNVVGEGYSLNISVTVTNEGDYTETFNVTVYGNTTSIASQNITLESGTSTAITFTWNTAGFAKGNYTIKAVAETLPGETDTADNRLIDGWVFITIPGDTNADKKVNILDCIMIANHFGHTNGNGHIPSTKEWQNCLNSDINGDLKVNILDCIIMAGHFGQKWL